TTAPFSLTNFVNQGTYTLRATNLATDIGISISPHGDVYVVGKDVDSYNNNTIYHYNIVTNQFDIFGGRGRRIAVDDNDNPWVISSAGVFKYNGSSYVNEYSGVATDIAIGNNQIFILANDPDANGDCTLLKFNGTTFVTFSGGGRGQRIAVDADGNPWVA